MNEKRADDGDLYRVVVVDPESGEASPCSHWQQDSAGLRELAQKLREEGRNAQIVIQERVTVVAGARTSWNWDPHALVVTEQALQAAKRRRPIVDIDPERLYSIDEATRLIAAAICPPTVPPRDESGWPIGGMSTPFEANRASLRLLTYRLIGDGTIVPRNIISRAPVENAPELFTEQDDQRFALTSDQVCVLCDNRFVQARIARIDEPSLDTREAVEVDAPAGDNGQSGVPRGVTRKALLAAPWPVDRGALERATRKPAGLLWLKGARLHEGTPGAPERDPGLWSPVIFATCLLDHYEDVTSFALTKVITADFPEWLNEWQEARRVLGE